MGYEATGTIKKIFDVEQKSEKFKKREFVLELADNPKYPQVVQFQLTGDRCSQLDGMNVGDAVRVEFSLRGREWTGNNGTKYFNSLDVWKVEAKGERRTASGSAIEPSNPAPPIDDLPFASASLADEPSAIARVLR